MLVFFFFFFSAVQYEGNDKCWLITEEYCKQWCYPIDKHDFCHFSSYPDPQLQNAWASVDLNYRGGGETFKITCKEGYMLPNGDYFSKFGRKNGTKFESAIFDCVPKTGNIIFKIDDANFKCKVNVRIHDDTVLEECNNVHETRQCLDECYCSSKCR